MLIRLLIVFFLFLIIYQIINHYYFSREGYDNVYKPYGDSENINEQNKNNIQYLYEVQTDMENTIEDISKNLYELRDTVNDIQDQILDQSNTTADEGSATLSGLDGENQDGTNDGEQIDLTQDTST